MMTNPCLPPARRVRLVSALEDEPATNRALSSPDPGRPFELIRVHMHAPC